MTNFGLAFGIITAGVLGTAFVVDHNLKDSPETTVRSTTTHVAEAPAQPPAVTPSAGEGDAATNAAASTTVIPPRTESPAAIVETPKAKAPVKVAPPARTTPAPSASETQTVTETAPATSDTSSAPPAPEPQKTEPQPAPASNPET